MELLDYEREHLEYLKGHLGECMVLLKKSDAFPLSAPCTIAAYGSGVRHTVKGGTGSGEVNSRYFVTIEEGLQNAGFTIVTGDWLDGYDKVLQTAQKAFVKDIRKRAKAAHMNPVYFGMGAVMAEPEYDLPLNHEADAAIYVLARSSGEGNDRNPVRGDILLSETEKRDILALNKKYEKFMLVINTGGPVDLSEVDEVKNILVLSQLGVETGNALAKVLLGIDNPSGKLTTTWSKWEDYCTIGEFGDEIDTAYKEGIYVGYRYFDTVGKRAMYPFGFGLSYTEFAMQPAYFNLEGTAVTVRVKVKNIGGRSGKEVVQLYVSVPSVNLDQPYQMLAAFGKTKELQPEEETEVTLSFRMEDIASYRAEDASYVLEQGDYILRVGNCSADANACGMIRMPETVVVTKCRNSLGKPDFQDAVLERQPEVGSKVPIIVAAANDFNCTTVTYDKEPEIDEIIKSLPDEELVYLNIGAFKPKGGLASVIGNASKGVAGAAGESYLCEKAKIPNLIMADGPAGVRVAKDYTQDENGVYALGNPMLDSLAIFLNWPQRMALKYLTKGKKTKGEVLHHYATALPIGTAIAQSWNTEFAYACGDIVGDEMARFGVHLWLAPAMNIHRSIRCGRNFEYFSEDPLISGKFAAALTKGVQKHPGCGVTIKHFAGNNQETNRYNNNSKVSERAMREIYLRGFEICVKEAQPKALMTSYNLINGVHGSERRDLTEDILRSEFGFDGLVMTDWIVDTFTDENAFYAPPKPYKVALAGNNLFMPGGQKNYDNIMAALKNGDLDRKTLEISAERVRRMATALAEKN